MILETLTLIDEFDNFIHAHIEAATECIPSQLRATFRVPWETLAFKKKRKTVKTASLRNKRNLTDANAQKFKKAQN